MVYEAVCKVCGKKVEYRTSIKERNNTPVCCKKPMERVLSPTPGKVI